jgi:type IV secretory pathway VirJ component
MMKTVLSIIILTSVLFSESRANSLGDSVNVAPFGKVYIYNKTDKPLNVVVMISGDAGWKYGVVSFAETFSEMGNLVIGVDITRYFKDLRKRSDDCYAVAADFVQLITNVEKKYNFPDYRPGVIMGYSSGATLVYGILAQARPGTFVGGISLGFCPDIELPKMLCQTNGLTEKVDVTGKSYFLKPDAKLGNHWIVLQGRYDSVCNYAEVADFVKNTSDADLITLLNVGHGFSKWSDFMPQWKDAFKTLTANNEKDLTTEVYVDKAKHFPAVITESKLPGKDGPIALLISGDGGWYSFEQMIADHLAKQGIPTIGLDSKKYFWNRRTPEETADDVAGILSKYSKVWGKDKFILIGYSLGAEIVPFILNRMRGEIKSNVISTVLLSPANTTDFEIHISNMLGMGNRQNTFNVIDEINKMGDVNTLIIFGDGEKTKVPELLTSKSVNIRMIPGDHHYKFNLPLIMQTMKDNKAF